MLASWGLAIASVIARRGENERGRIAAVVLLVVFVGCPLLPENQAHQE